MIQERLNIPVLPRIKVRIWLALS